MENKVEPGPMRSASGCVDFESWLESLATAHSDLLKDETALAKAAFEAAFQLGQASVEPLINYRFVARRDADTSTWSGQYFENSGCSYAHERSIKKAFQANSVEKLYEAMAKRLTGYGGIKQAVGTYTIFKVARDKAVQTVAVGVVPIVLESQQWSRKNTLSRVYNDLSRFVSSATRIRDGRFTYADDITWAWENLRAISLLMSIDLPSEPHASKDGIKEVVDQALIDLKSAISEPENEVEARPALETMAKVLRRASLETKEVLMENIAA